MSAKIFINYRRGDDPGNTGRLFDRLQEAFRSDQLFMDVDSIKPGLDFVKVLEEQVSQCEVVLAVIGHNWIDARDETGGRRLDNPEDFVRIEIASALAQGKRVIPVLVGDARMPRSNELPEPIKPLARRHAVRLTHERFRADVQGLVKALHEALEEADALRGAEAGTARQAAKNKGRERAEQTARKLAEAHRATDESTRRDKNQTPLTPAQMAEAAETSLRDWQGALRHLERWRTSQRSIMIGGAVVVAIAVVAAAWIAGLPTALTVRPQAPLVVQESTATPLSPARERALKPNDTFKECPTCPEMMVVPAGAFTMGSPASEAGRYDDEGLLRRVTFAQPLAIGKFSITRGQFAAFVDGTGHKTDGGCYTWAPEKAELQAESSWLSPGFGQDDRHPVVCVNWSDANAFVAWLSRNTGKQYRLLTEAEFEFAARGGTRTRYFFGDDEKDFCRYGNGADETARKSNPGWAVLPCSDGYVYTAPVGRFMPNEFGLYDMLGNAWQWIEDCYRDKYDRVRTDGSASTSGDCGRRVVRGGSWSSSGRILRSADRDWLSTDVRPNNVGFRVARTLTP